MIVFRQHRIFRKDIQANPHILYIFGDNLDRKGFGGQAREMRGEPNSFGIATKRSISHNFPNDYFFDADEDAIRIIEGEFRRLRKQLMYRYIHDEPDYNYDAICIPLDGIGTGLSRLPETAPKLLKYIERWLEELSEL